MKEYYVGVDLGGTKILTALADARGKIVAKKKLPTEARKGEEKVIQNIVSSIDAVLQEKGLSREDVITLGVGSPGPLNTQEGIIYLAPNLGWRNVHIKDILEEETGIPVILENDANAAALGEKWFGAGQDVDNLIYITVSTGIGGGIIINKKIFHGINDGAGEVGHMVIEPGGPVCGCGNRGCFEAVASGTAINKMGREAVKENKATLLMELSGGDPEKIDGSLIARAARQGDEVARKIWDKAGYYLGIGLANLLNIFNPEMIILGGGVMNAGDLIMEPMKKSLKDHALESAFNSVEIRQAELGNDTGVIGAVAVAMGDRLLE
ncbi:ROK family protein [Halothermothrix orenii]|uniref:Glucokinase n=1 Tax=Halothermothrix orenii (strain H 168 / OCM 544 / DSM 9562) TaxID=373903 RepID=B8CYI5_HALOH|nr:ROK family protein [Halothermothrix orenii]ACL70354.1 glucokinase [Halothermothrix orenii H 168]